MDNDHIGLGVCESAEKTNTSQAENGSAENLRLFFKWKIADRVKKYSYKFKHMFS